MRFDWDLASRVSLALDRTGELDRTGDFDDSGLTEYDAAIDGRVRFAPGLAWAHASCRAGRHLAVFPLPLGGVRVGKVPVTVADATLEIFLVAAECQHVAFFRAAITLENADETQFARLAQSALPALGWADDVWGRLRDLSRPYREVRGELLRCLGGLSDHGAACFEELQAGDPRQLASALSARVGTETSDENGATKRYRESRRDRARRHCGIDKVFRWHVKLRPNADRIHFLYEPPPAGLAGPGGGRLVVGLFKAHCVLPN